MNQRRIIQGIEQPDVGDFRKDLSHGLTYLGIHVNGEDKTNVRKSVRQVADRQAKVAQGLAEALTPMGRQEHEATIFGKVRQGPRRPRVRALQDEPQRIDDRVARHMNALVGMPFAEQGPTAVFGGGEEQVGDPIGHVAVEFLGKGALKVPGAQARLDVAETDVIVEGDQRSDQDGGRVALGQDPIGPLATHEVVQGREEGRREGREPLVGPHEVQVHIGPDREGGQHLVEHLAMLARDANDRAHLMAPTTQFEHDGRHLDRFGTSPHHAKHQGHAARSLSFSMDHDQFAGTGRPEGAMRPPSDLSSRIGPPRFFVASRFDWP